MDSAIGPPKTIKQKIWHFIEHPLALTGAAVVLALIGTKGTFAFAWILLTIAAIRTKFFETSPPRRRVVGNSLLSVGIAVGLSIVWAIWFREPDKPAISTYAQSVVNPVGVYVAGLPWRWILLGGAIGAAIGEVFTKRWVRKYPERLGIVIEEICPHKRLHGLAKDDKEFIERRVRIPWIIYRPEFEGTEPYIDFVFSIFNNSLFDLVINNSFKGDIWSDSFDNPLHYEPKFFPARPVVCRSRSGASFVIRHALRVEEVARFKGQENLLIWFDGLEITFAGTEQFPEIGAARLNTKGFCLKVKEGAWRNPNDKDEFAFLYTDEQWAVLASANQEEVSTLKAEIAALKSQPSGQTEILSRAELNNLQQQHETLRNEKESLAAELERLQRYKLLLDVDVALSMDGWEPQQSSLFLHHDKGILNPPGIEPVLIDRYELRAGIRIRFDNRDSSPQREQKVSVVLQTDTDSYELHVAAYEDKRYIKTLSDILVHGGDTSPYYDLTCDTTLEVETVDRLGASSYLRVTLEAINQDLYCVDLSVDWNKAREGKEVFFAIQRKGDCTEPSRLIPS